MRRGGARPATTQPIAACLLQTINLSCWLTGLAVALAAGCTWPFQAIAVLAFMRGITVACILLWMLVMMSSMALKRQRPTADSNPDEMLVLDATWQAKVRTHVWKVVVCGGIVAMSILSLVSRVSDPSCRYLIWAARRLFVHCSCV